MCDTDHASVSSLESKNGDRKSGRRPVVMLVVVRRLDHQDRAARVLRAVVAHAPQERPANTQERRLKIDGWIDRSPCSIQSNIPLDGAEATAADDEQPGAHVLGGAAQRLPGITLHHHALRAHLQANDAKCSHVTSPAPRRTPSMLVMHMQLALII